MLRALDKKDEQSQQLEPLKGASTPRWLRVRVTDIKTGRNKVNVNIPMGPVNVGMKMGARFAPEIEGAQLESVMEAIRGGQQGKVIDVYDEEDGEHVEIFVE
ncbi:MAG: hypothetical protein R3C44_05710 [Chloroflexota bacterium]